MSDEDGGATPEGGKVARPGLGERLRGWKPDLDDDPTALPVSRGDLPWWLNFGCAVPLFIVGAAAAICCVLA